MLKYRDGRQIDQPNGQDRLLGLLYGNLLGRMLLRPLVTPFVSKLAGRFLSSGMSRMLIKPFIRRNRIDMAQFEAVRYGNYNEFFSRKIKPGQRPIDFCPEHLIAPCDSKLTALKISPESRFSLKHTEYSLESRLRSAALAEK